MIKGDFKPIEISFFVIFHFEINLKEFQTKTLSRTLFYELDWT